MAYHKLPGSESWFYNVLSSDSANKMQPQLSVSLALQTVETGTFVWKLSNGYLSVNLGHCHCPAEEENCPTGFAFLRLDALNCGLHRFKNFRSRSVFLTVFHYLL